VGLGGAFSIEGKKEAHGRESWKAGKKDKDGAKGERLLRAQCKGRERRKTETGQRLARTEEGGGFSQSCWSKGVQKERKRTTVSGPLWEKLNSIGGRGSWDQKKKEGSDVTNETGREVEGVSSQRSRERENKRWKRYQHGLIGEKLQRPETSGIITSVEKWVYKSHGGQRTKKEMSGLNRVRRRAKGEPDNGVVKEKKPRRRPQVSMTA